jgi:hypothetical protein
MIAKTESIIKQADPEVIVQGTMYDEPSSRLYVTVVKGVRKTDIVLPRHYFENGSGERVEKNVRAALARLERTPVG